MHHTQAFPYLLSYTPTTRLDAPESTIDSEDAFLYEYASACS